MIYATAVVTHNGKRTFTIDNIELPSDAAERGAWEEEFFAIAKRDTWRILEGDGSEGVLLFELRLISTDSTPLRSQGRVIPPDEVVDKLELRFRRRPRRGQIFG